MKIFLDTADLESIKKLVPTGLIDGITTNPSNLSKISGDPKETIMQICKLLPAGHISVEVTEQDPEKLYQQAKVIAGLADNIWVKIPCHAHYYPVIKKLVQQGVKLNITLVFSLLQSVMMCKLGVYYISPFVGRLEQAGHDGVELLYQIRHMIDYYGFETKMLAASLRSVEHVQQAVLAGSDAATMAPTIFEQAIAHELTDKGMQTFAQDWQKIQRGVFP